MEKVTSEYHMKKFMNVNRATLKCFEHKKMLIRSKYV